MNIGGLNWKLEKHEGFTRAVAHNPTLNKGSWRGCSYDAPGSNCTPLVTGDTYRQVVDGLKSFEIQIKRIKRPLNNHAPTKRPQPTSRPC